MTKRSGKRPKSTDETAPTASPRLQPPAVGVQESLLVFLVILLLAAAIRLVRLGSFGIWEDEGYTAMLVSQPWRDFFYILFHFESSPPVYYVFLKLWASVFGMSEVSLKLPSLILSLGALGGLYSAARRHFGANAAAVAGLLFAFSPMQTWYSHNFRYFALVEVIAVVSTGKALDIARSVELGEGVKTRDLFWWGLLMVLGFYTHVFFALAFAIQVGYIVWVALTCRREVRRVVTTGAAVIALCLPWIGPFVSQQRTTLAFQTALSQPHLPDYGRTLCDFLFLYAPHWSSLWYALPFGLVLIIAALGAWSKVGLRSARWYLFACVVIPPLVALALAAALHQPLLFNRRYFIPSSVTMLMLAGVALLDVEALVKRRLKFDWELGGVKEVALVALLALNVLGLGYMYTAPFAVNRDWRSAAEYMRMRESDEITPRILMLHVESGSNLTTCFANCFSYYWLQMGVEEEPQMSPDRFIVSPDGPVGANAVLSARFQAEGEAGRNYFAYSPPNVPFSDIGGIVNREAARYGLIEVWFIYPLRFSGTTGMPVPIGYQMLKYLPGRYMIKLSYQFDGVGMDCAVPDNLTRR